MVTNKILRERFHTFIYEVNKIGVNYNQVVAIWQKQAGRVRKDGTPRLNTRDIEGYLVKLIKYTEGLRDEFALIYDVIKKYLMSEEKKG